MRARIFVLFAAVAASAPAVAAEGDDDLALVRRAVASAGQSVAAEQATPVARAPQPPPPRAEGASPSWLKVRIAEEDADGATLSVNLPLALVRAIDAATCDEEREERGFGLEDLLAGLRSGQSLVSIESDDTEVRVWVE